MLPQDMVGIFHDVHEHIHCTVAVSHAGFFQQFGVFIKHLLDDETVMVSHMLMFHMVYLYASVVSTARGRAML